MLNIYLPGIKKKDHTFKYACLWYILFVTAGYGATQTQGCLFGFWTFPFVFPSAGDSSFWDYRLPVGKFRWDHRCSKPTSILARDFQFPFKNAFYLLLSPLWLPLRSSWVRPWDGAMFPKLGNVCRWNGSHQNCIFKALWLWDRRQNVKECVRTQAGKFRFYPPRQPHNYIHLCCLTFRHCDQRGTLSQVDTMQRLNLWLQHSKQTFLLFFLLFVLDFVFTIDLHVFFFIDK